MQVNRAISSISAAAESTVGLVFANVAWFLAGLATLVVGAEILVRGATKVASRLGISPTQT